MTSRPQFFLLHASALAGMLVLCTADTAPGTTILPSVGSGTLRLHLAADTGVTRDGLNRVSQWDDQSGQGNDFNQTTTSQQPLWVPKALSDNPVIRFDGVDDFVRVIGTGLDDNPTGSTSSATNALDDAFTLFITASGSNPLGLFDSAHNQPQVARFFNNNAFELWNGNPSLAVTLDASGTILAIRGDNTRSLDILNRALATMSDTASSAGGTTADIAWGDPIIGNINVGTAGHFAGDVFEVILFEGSLSNADRDAVIAAMNDAATFVVPEPASAMLLAIGMAPLVRTTRRRHGRETK